MKKYWKSLGLYGIIFVIILGMLAFAGKKVENAADLDYTYSDLILELENNQIKQIELQRNSDVDDFGTVKAVLKDGKIINVNIPSVSTFQNRLDEKLMKDRKSVV